MCQIRPVRPKGVRLPSAAPMERSRQTPCRSRARAQAVVGSGDTQVARCERLRLRCHVEVEALAGEVVEVDARLRSCRDVLDPCLARPHIEPTAVLLDESDRLAVGGNRNTCHRSSYRRDDANALELRSHERTRWLRSDGAAPESNFPTDHHWGCGLSIDGARGDACRSGEIGVAS